MESKYGGGNGIRLIDSSLSIYEYFNY